MKVDNNNNELPEWTNGKNAIVVWRREKIITESNIDGVKIIEPSGSYRDPESELPISGEDMIEKVMKNKQGWLCMGVFIVNEVVDGLPCQKTKAVLVRFPRLMGY